MTVVELIPDPLTKQGTVADTETYVEHGVTVVHCPLMQVELGASQVETVVIGFAEPAAVIATPASPATSLAATSNAHAETVDNICVTIDYMEQKNV